jgi:hypothetical protein
MDTGGISGALPKAAYATITAPLHFPKILRVILQKLLDGSSIAAYSSKAFKSLNPGIFTAESTSDAWCIFRCFMMLQQTVALD